MCGEIHKACEDRDLSSIRAIVRTEKMEFGYQPFLGLFA